MEECDRSPSKHIIEDLLPRAVTFYFSFTIKTAQLCGFLFERPHVSFGILTDADVDCPLDKSLQEEMYNIAEADSRLLRRMESLLIQGGIEPDGRGAFGHYE